MSADDPPDPWRERPLVSLPTAGAGLEGEGFPVRRAFDGVDPALPEPSVRMGQRGSVDYAPFAPRGTDWHPQRGLETVTYIIDGSFVHQDSNGGGGKIADGAGWLSALSRARPLGGLLIDSRRRVAD